jgi:hypothetical protein
MFSCWAEHGALVVLLAGVLVELTRLRRGGSSDR